MKFDISHLRRNRAFRRSYPESVLRATAGADISEGAAHGSVMFETPQPENIRLPVGAVNTTDASSFDTFAALNAGEIGVWHWDLKAGRMHGSEQMFRNLRIAPDDGGDLFHRLLAAIHASDRETVAAAFAEFARRPGPVRVEARLAGADEEPRWIVFLGHTEAGADGIPARSHGITIDSTRRRKAEEASAAALTASEGRLREVNQRLQRVAERRHRQLGASRAQIQAIFDNSPDWLTLFRATPDGRFIYADLNRATEQAYGLGELSLNLGDSLQDQAAWG
jgi:PAS domain-containing protein